LSSVSTLPWIMARTSASISAAGLSELATVCPPRSTVNAVGDLLDLGELVGHQQPRRAPREATRAADIQKGCDLVGQQHRCRFVQHEQ